MREFVFTITFKNLMNNLFYAKNISYFCQEKKCTPTLYIRYLPAQIVSQLKYFFPLLNFSFCTLTLNIQYFHALSSVDGEQAWDWVLIFLWDIKYRHLLLPSSSCKNSSYPEPAPILFINLFISILYIYEYLWDIKYRHLSSSSSCKNSSYIENQHQEHRNPHLTKTEII